MPLRTVQTRFFCFDQNNSGGRFDCDSEKGIGPYVIIEAFDAIDANLRAENVGIYFDGDRDCSCCGHRWREAYGKGDEVPSIYGQDVSEGIYVSEWVPSSDGPAYIHFLDGTLKEVRIEKRR